MSLPAAMAALKRGEIEPPTDDGSLSALVDGPIHAQPARPQADLTPEFEAQRMQDAEDREAMHARIIDRRNRLSSAGSESRDANANIAEAAQRHKALRRLDAAEAQLMEITK